MSTEYAVTITCDAKRSPACQGSVRQHRDEVSALAHVVRWAQDEGWRRRHLAYQTYDVCPACHPLLEPEAQPEQREGAAPGAEAQRQEAAG